MKIIGIDLGPKKGIHVLDGKKDKPVKLDEVRKYLSNLKKGNEDLLICWDSPLKVLWCLSQMLWGLSQITDIHHSFSDKERSSRS